MSQKSTLRLLAESILDAVSRIEDQFESAGLAFPSLSDPFNTQDPTTALLFHPDVVAQSSIIHAAAEQLSASVRPPPMFILETAAASHKSACIQTVIAASVTEILREAGPHGLHVKEIAKKNGIHPDKLARVLRVLATHHIFTEVAPDVFSNNRLSSAMDTGNSVDDLLSKPKDRRYTSSSGVVAIVDLASHILKMSESLSENLIDPITGHSDDPTQAAFNRAFDTKDDYWTWLNKPGNELRRDNFAVAMDISNKMDPKDSILRGFPWKELPDNAKIVDVGGNIGSVSLLIAAQYPKFNFVVQDFEHVVEQARPIWDEQLPGALDSGRVVFQTHDFFNPQPVKDADVFMLRATLHDWGSSYAIRILRQLRDAAVVGKTKLLIVDQVVAHACKTDAEIDGIKMTEKFPVPEFLLPNLGRANAATYLFDIEMMSAFNGQERTVESFLRDTSEAGWRITHIYTVPGSLLQHVVAEAV